MAQVGNKNIDNASGQVVRLDMQNTVQAVATNNFGQRTSGGTILPCEFLADDTTNKLLIRGSTGGDQADPSSSSAATFFEVGDIDSDNLGLLPKAGGTMTGPILGDDAVGAATPAFSFDGDDDTGMFRQSANSIGFSTGGSQKFQMDANGLSIFSDNSATKNIYFFDVNNSNYVAVRSPATVNANVSLTLPSTIVNGGFLQVDASGNLSFQTISTSAGGLSGNTLSSNIINSSLTSVGTLGTLTVSGNSQFQGNIHAGGDINGDTATNIVGMAAIECSSLAATSIIHVTGGLYGAGLTNKEPLFYTGVGGAAGKLVRAFCKFNGFSVTNPASLTGVTSSYNVGSITDNGVGDYSVNYLAGAMRDSNGNATNEHAVSIQTNNQVFPVQGQLAHTHPMLSSSDVNHVRFICAKDEDSSKKADNATVMVSVVL